MNPDLQDFPVDDETLDLLEAAMTTGDVSCLTSTLDLLAGINPDDLEAHSRPVIEDGTYYDGIMEDDRPHYHQHGVMLALIAEVRRLRAVAAPTRDST